VDVREARRAVATIAGYRRIPRRTENFGDSFFEAHAVPNEVLYFQVPVRLPPRLEARFRALDARFGEALVRGMAGRVFADGEIIIYHYRPSDDAGEALLWGRDPVQLRHQLIREIEEDLDYLEGVRK